MQNKYVTLREERDVKLTKINSQIFLPIDSF